jgi:hypothetical protein
MCKRRISKDYYPVQKNPFLIIMKVIVVKKSITIIISTCSDKRLYPQRN